ncbi:hypothetical protein [Alkalicoccus daliensis]|uniref:Uncharacterized protein n=1 Tax=Alkalicoccus daliensis TaxID=745820 RepID=A0A1H0CLJ5_9BACI|nr:hypothetical protein [Alkalicoccus daliensis]SDN58754.1 hypothetical protein SAMN04488053_102149 [Alkalicoccus daliensis]
MMYIFITIAFVLLLGIMLLIPSVFTRKMTTLLVSVAFLFSLGGYWALENFYWPFVLGSLALVILVTAFAVSRYIPEGDPDALEEPDEVENEVQAEKTAAPQEENQGNDTAENPEEENAALEEENYYYDASRKPLQGEDIDEQSEEEDTEDLPERTDRGEHTEEREGSPEAEEEALSRRERLFKQLEDER